VPAWGTRAAPTAPALNVNVCPRMWKWNTRRALAVCQGALGGGGGGRGTQTLVTRQTLTTHGM
jgi:hypothetical protein